MLFVCCLLCVLSSGLVRISLKRALLTNFFFQVWLAFNLFFLHSFRRSLDEARPTVMGAQPSAPLSMSDVLVDHVAAARRPRTNATRWE